MVLQTSKTYCIPTIQITLSVQTANRLIQNYMQQQLGFPEKDFIFCILMSDPYNPKIISTRSRAAVISVTETWLYSSVTDGET